LQIATDCFHRVLDCFLFTNFFAKANKLQLIVVIGYLTVFLFTNFFVKVNKLQISIDFFQKKEQINA